MNIITRQVQIPYAIRIFRETNLRQLYLCLDTLLKLQSHHPSSVGFKLNVVTVIPSLASHTPLIKTEGSGVRVYIELFPSPGFQEKHTSRVLLMEVAIK